MLKNDFTFQICYKKGYKPVKYSVTQCKYKIFEFLGGEGSVFRPFGPLMDT